MSEADMDKQKDVPTDSKNITESIEEQMESTEPTTSNMDSSEFMESISSLATMSNMLILLGILGVYFIIYFVLGKFFNREENPTGFNMNLSKTLDMLFLIIISIIGYNLYQAHRTNPEKGIVEDSVQTVSGFMFAPGSIFTTLFFIVVFYIVAYLFRIPMDSMTKPIFMTIIESGSWLVLVVLLFINFFKYILNIPLNGLVPSLKPTDKPLQMDDVELEKKKDAKDEKDEKDEKDAKDTKCEKDTKDATDPDAEVFNVANNLYTYEDARAVCKAYNAELATYEQVEDAYNKGAEWCNYGWSEDQLALFPTQKKTWSTLQKTDKHKNDCGRPGVNGGYIANPYVRFGVNCFGKKPEPTDADLVRLNSKQNQLYPKTTADIALENKVDYWKQNADKVLQLNSYSTTSWNRPGVTHSKKLENKPA